MTTDETAPNTTEKPTEQGTDPLASDPTAEDAGTLADWKRRARQHEAEAKRLAGWEAKAEAAQARVAELEQRERQYRIATEVGIPVDLADRLRGGDDDALREDARRVLAHMRPNGKPQPQGGDGGPRGGTPRSDDPLGDALRGPGRRG